MTRLKMLAGSLWLSQRQGERTGGDQKLVGSMSSRKLEIPNWIAKSFEKKKRSRPREREP